MPPLDFPASPTVGQTHPGPAGVLWSWDGAKWANGQTSVGSGVSSWNARTGAVTQTSADVTTALAYTPYNSTNPSGYQTAANVTATVNAAQRYPNYADNSGFSVNRRTYVSGVALGAGVYGHDRWKAGAGGCTYTFTASGGPSNTITITAGTLQQVVEGLSIVGGNYTLSWTGTAQGRVGAGSYAASPVAVTGITAGANTTIEFGTGTLGQAKLEAGTVVTPWVARDAASELANCQRFYQTGYVHLDAAGTAGFGFRTSGQFPVTMRAAPTMVLSGTTLTNCARATIAAVGGTSYFTYAAVTASSFTSWASNYTASSDL